MTTTAVATGGSIEFMTAESTERAGREAGRVSYGDLARALRLLAANDHPDEALLIDLASRIEEGQELRPAGRARKVSVSRDAAVHRVLARVAVVPVTPELGRQAGELLGATGLSGHRHAVDAVLAATALATARPVVLLTSDPDDLNRLVEEPGRSKGQRVVVVHV
jgi:hypothetical protein